MSFLDLIPWNQNTAPAITDRRGTLTYRELHTRAFRAAAALRARFGNEGVLLLEGEPTTDFAVALLATMISGLTPAPIDPLSPPATIEFVRDKTGAISKLTPGDVSQLVEEQGDSLKAPLGGAESSAAIVMMTSGTSGFPKGVLISHANLSHSCRAISEYLEYDRYRSAAIVLPLHYSYALLSQLCAQLTCGGHVRMFDASETRNPLKLAAAVSREELQTFCGVPSTFFALRTVHRLSTLCFPTVNVVCSAGAAIDPVLYGDIREMFPAARLYNNYGMTEAAPRIAFIRDDDERFGESTCGRPMPGVEVQVVDPDTHAVLLDGERGVLVVRGPNITSGYINDPEATQAAFTADGWLISGDEAYLDRGYIFLSGRLDEMFNVGGEKVAPIEIERALNQLDVITCAAVTGIRDEARGTIPVAFLQLAGKVSRRDLVENLRVSLPPIKIPHRFFEVRAFPVTPNGKLVRRRLSIDDPEHVIREIL